MSIQTYNCPKDGNVDYYQPITAEVQETIECPRCGSKANWKPSFPASIHVEGGTGAGRKPR